MQGGARSGRGLVAAVKRTDQAIRDAARARGQEGTHLEVLLDIRDYHKQAALADFFQAVRTANINTNLKAIAAKLDTLIGLMTP